MKRRLIATGGGVLAAALLAALGMRYHLYRQNLAVLPRPLLQGPVPHKGDRLLVFAPHCDDETLACGGLIARAVKAGAEVKVVFVTNGDGFKYAAEEAFRKIKVKPQEYMRFAQLRQAESREALSLLGVSGSSVVFLGYPDRGTAVMWAKDWSLRTPYTSPFTRSNHSPYPDSYRPKALYCGLVELTDVLRILRDYQPTKVAFPHPNDAHPDHWATHAFVSAALEEMELAGERVPTSYNRLTYLVHRGDWPAPKGFHSEDPLVPPASLITGETVWVRLPVRDELSQKERALRCYRSQLPLLKRYMFSFLRSTELFGINEPVPVIGSGAPRMSDRAKADWSEDDLVITDPASDTVSRGLVGAGDITSVLAKVTGGELCIRVETREKVKGRITYIVSLDALFSARQGAPMHKVQMSSLRHSPARLVWVFPRRSGEPVHASMKGCAADFRLPLALLGNPPRVMLRAASLAGKLEIDRTAYRVLWLR